MNVGSTRQLRFVRSESASGGGGAADSLDGLSAPSTFTQRPSAAMSKPPPRIRHWRSGAPGAQHRSPVSDPAPTLAQIFPANLPVRQSLASRDLVVHGLQSTRSAR